MPLEPGVRFGPYEVTSPLGVGGMGEVYRARDAKLNRDVALKFLPEAFTFDPDRLARFSREAQLLASLNHPNIGAIYGLEESNHTRALVLELVEGPTRRAVSVATAAGDGVGHCLHRNRRHRICRGEPEAHGYAATGHSIRL
jgi:serine/threonine protein kinase